MNKIFVPHELKTIEVDTEKKIFRINGEDFGRECIALMYQHCITIRHLSVKVKNIKNMTARFS